MRVDHTFQVILEWRKLKLLLRKERPCIRSRRTANCQKKIDDEKKEEGRRKTEGKKKKDKKMNF